MESYSTALGILGAEPFGDAVDCNGTTRGTNQRFLVPIRRDQNQRFRRSKLFYTPTSHSRPFRRGIVARIWLPHLATQIYREPCSRAKARRPLDTDPERQMSRSLRVPVWSLLFLGSLAGSAGAQQVHQIRLVANPAREIYRFEPAQVAARPGDVLVFKAAAGTPHSIVFEGAKLSEQSHEALNGAMSRRSADLSSPLLTLEGSEYRMVVPALAPGTYEFFCLPHRAYDMRGTLIISK